MTVSDQLWYIAHSTDPETGEVFDFESLKEDSRVLRSVALLSLKLGLKTQKFHPDNPENELSDQVFEELRKWRLEKSKEIGMPAYYVFSDSDLLEISLSDVEDKEDLMLIRGIGPVKYELYGAEIFSILKGQIKTDQEISSRYLKEKIDNTSTDYPYNIFKKLSTVLSIPDDICTRMDAVFSNDRVFSEKNRREKDILLLYFKEHLTYEKIGDQYGITRSRVGQIINGGLKKLQRKAVITYLSGNAPELFDNMLRTTTMPMLTHDQLLQFPYDANGISISEIARRLTNLKQHSQPGRVNYYDIAFWLIMKGDLIETKEDKSNRTPTEQGKEHGFAILNRVNKNGIEYSGLVADINAQRYIVDHYEDIITVVTTQNEKE